MLEGCIPAETVVGVGKRGNAAVAQRITCLVSIFNAVRAPVETLPSSLVVQFYQQG